MARVKVSSKHQISVPSEVRRKLNIRSGDQLLIDIRNGYVVLIPEPKRYAERLRGLHREVWSETDPQEYVHREREDWES